MKTPVLVIDIQQTISVTSMLMIYKNWLNFASTQIGWWKKSIAHKLLWTLLWSQCSVSYGMVKIVIQLKHCESMFVQYSSLNIYMYLYVLCCYATSIFVIIIWVYISHSICDVLMYPVYNHQVFVIDVL